MGRENIEQSTLQNQGFSSSPLSAEAVDSFIPLAPVGAGSLPDQLDLSMGGLYPQGLSGCGDKVLNWLMTPVTNKLAPIVVGAMNGLGGNKCAKPK
ncbi:hypothetical protein BH10CYA1_BH10CYA1_03650 [soil metagenome]